MHLFLCNCWSNKDLKNLIQFAAVVTQLCFINYFLFKTIHIYNCIDSASKDILHLHSDMKQNTKTKKVLCTVDMIL